MIKRSSFLTLSLLFLVFLNTYGQISWTNLGACSGTSHSIVMSQLNAVLVAKDLYLCRADYPLSNWDAVALAGVNCLAACNTINNFIYAGTGLTTNGQVYISTDDGLTFVPCAPITTGLIEDIEVTSFGTVLAATQCTSMGCAGLFRSADDGASWVQVADPYKDVYCISSDSNGNIYIGTQDTTAGGEAIIRKSTDDGLTWTTLGSGELGTGYVRGISVDEAGYIYALGGGGNLYVSDNGGPFSFSLSGLNANNKFPMLSTNCNLTLLGDYGNGIYVTNDRGATWVTANTGLNSLYVTDMLFSSSKNVFISSGTDACVCYQNFVEPSAAWITGLLDICENSTQNYHIDGNFILNVDWTIPAGWILNSGQGTTTINVTADSTSGSVCATITNICGTGTQGCRSIDVYIHPDTAIVNGPNLICEGSSQVYTASAVNSTTLQWVVPTGWTINFGQGSPTVYVTANGNSGNVCARPTNGPCYGSWACIFVSVAQIPDAPVVNGPTSVCEGSIQTYIATSALAEGVNWTVPLGWTINSGQGTLELIVTVGNSSGSVWAYPTNGPCLGPPGGIPVNVIHMPVSAGPIIGPNSVCINQSWVYSVPPIWYSTSYVWTLPSGDTTTQTDSILIHFGDLPGSYDLAVKGQNTCGYGNNSTKNIIIDPCTGMNEIESKVNLSISPIPSDGVIELTISGFTDNVEFNVFNDLGQLIYTEAIRVQTSVYSQKIDLTSQPKGLYYLKVKAKDISKAQKIILQ